MADYVIEMYWKDEQDKLITGYIVSDDKPESEEDDDMNVFYYVDDEEELKALMKVDNGEDFVITSYEKRD